MEFSHIIEAIKYAQNAGNQEELMRYVLAHNNATANKILPILGSVKRAGTDDIYFLIAFMEILTKVCKSNMNETERRLIDDVIKPTVKITAVRIQLPSEIFPGCSDN